MKTIEKEEQYEDALAQAYVLMQQDLSTDSKEWNEFENLVLLIREYEQEHYPINSFI